MRQEAAMVSAVLLSYKRVHNLKVILDALWSTESIEEVILWNNAPETWPQIRELVVERYADRALHVMQDVSQRNLYTWGRFRGIMAASKPLIYTQDDDVMVMPDKIEELVRKHRESERLVARLDAGHSKWAEVGGRYEHRYDGGRLACWEMLLGWGSVFPRWYVEYVAGLKFDDLLCRKADRLFTMMVNQEHEVVTDKIDHLEGAWDRRALYRMKDHWSLNADAAVRATANLEGQLATAGVFDVEQEVWADPERTERRPVVGRRWSEELWGWMVWLEGHDAWIPEKELATWQGETTTSG